MKDKNIIKSIVLIPLMIACNISVAKQDNISSKPDSTKNGFAVLELFTSEGCSSCPPADAVLAKLSSEYKGNVYALGFHVDYWNRLGWTDSFSNPAYSKRQEKYAAQLHLNSIYTPQLIINGKTELIGSDERKARTVLVKELENTATRLIQLSAKQNGSNIDVSYETGKSTDDILNIVLVQLNATTEVKKGENRGHTLSHINVVRDFITVDINNLQNGKVSLNLPRVFTVNDYSVIGYLQDKNDLTIKAVAESAIQ